MVDGKATVELTANAQPMIDEIRRGRVEGQKEIEKLNAASARAGAGKATSTALTSNTQQLAGAGLSKQQIEQFNRGLQRESNGVLNKTITNIKGLFAQAAKLPAGKTPSFKVGDLEYRHLEDAVQHVIQQGVETTARNIGRRAGQIGASTPTNLLNDLAKAHDDFFTRYAQQKIASLKNASIPGSATRNAIRSGNLDNLYTPPESQGRVKVTPQRVPGQSGQYTVENNGERYTIQRGNQTSKAPFFIRKDGEEGATSARTLKEAVASLEEQFNRSARDINAAELRLRGIAEEARTIAATPATPASAHTQLPPTNAKLPPVQTITPVSTPTPPLTKIQYPDDQKALRELELARRSAFNQQKIELAGTRGSKDKFFNGLATATDDASKGFVQNLAALRQHAAQLGPQQTLAPGTIPGFTGSTVTEAIAHFGDQATQRYAETIGRRAGESNIEVPQATLTRLSDSFDTVMGRYGRDYMSSLEQELGQPHAALGTGFIQSSLPPGHLQNLAEQARQDVQDKARGTANAEQLQRLERQAENARIRQQFKQEAEASQFAATGAPPAGGGQPPRVPPAPPSNGGFDPGDEASRLAYEKLLQARQNRANFAHLTDDSGRYLQNVHQAANDIVVQYINGALNAYHKTRDGREYISPDAPEFKSAIEGAQFSRREASDFIQGARGDVNASVTDLPNRSVAVTIDGYTRFFKAMQDGARELVQHLPEADRAGEAFNRILQERENAALLDVQRLVSPQAIRDVGNNRVADFSEGPAGQPRVFAPTVEGRTELGDTGRDADAFRKAVRQGWDQLAGEARKEMVDAQRAIRPQDFVDLGRGYFADIGNKQRTIYKDLDGAYDEIAQGVRGFQGANKTLEERYTRDAAGNNVPRISSAQPLSGDSADEKRAILAQQENAKITQKQLREAQTAAIAQDKEFNRSRIESLKGSDQAVSLGRRTVVLDQAALQGGVPEVYQGDRKLDALKESDTYWQSVTEALYKLEGQARKGLLDAERALRPEDFVSLGNGYVADIGNKQRIIYREIDDVVTVLEEGMRGLASRAAQLDKLVGTIPVPFANAGENYRRPSAERRSPTEADAQIEREAQQQQGKRDAAQAKLDEQTRLEQLRQVPVPNNIGRQNKAPFLGAVDVPGGYTVDYSTGTPRAFKNLTSGGAEERTEAQAPKSQPKALRDAAQQVYDSQNKITGNLGKQFLEAERISDPRRIIDLGGNYTARIQGAFRTLYHETDQIADSLVKGTGGWMAANRRFQAKVTTDTAGNFLPTDEAKAAALQRTQRLEDLRQRRLDRLRERGIAVDTPGGFTVDRSGATPRVYRTAGGAEGGGARPIGPSGKGVQDAIAEAENIVAARLREASLGASRAARPQDFTDLTEKIFAEIRNGLLTIYEKTKRGVEEVAATSPKYQGLKDEAYRRYDFGNDRFLQQNQAQKRARQNQAQQGVNLQDLHEANGAFKEGVIPFGSLVADIRTDILRLFRKTQAGYEELIRDTPEYTNAKNRYVQGAARRASGGGIGGAIYSGFAAGGFGGDGGGGTLAEGILRSGATTAKYAALGTALYGISAAAHQAFSEFEDFDDSVTELSVAFQEPDRAIRHNQELLSNLADSASQAGSNVGEAMDAAASAVRAFGTDSETGLRRTDGELQSLGESFAREGSRIAILTKTTLTDAVGNLKATTLGFDLNPDVPERVTDALANAKLVGGGDEKEIGQGVANISVAAKQAGFSLEEMSNIVSEVIGETDQGGQLVAQRLSRIFSIIGGSAGQQAIRTLNDSLSSDKKIAQGPGVTTAEQVKGLSAVYNQLSQAQQKLLVNQLGGTANARELIILLQQGKDLTSAANLDTAGKGAEEYAKRLSNVRAEIANIQGNIKELISALSNSGLLAPLGLMLDVVKYITNAARKLVEAFNGIPSIIRTIAAGLAGLAIGMKAFSALSSAGGPKGLLGKLEETYHPERKLARDQLEAERRHLAALGPEAGLPGEIALAAQQRKQDQAAARTARREAIRAGRPAGESSVAAFRTLTTPIRGTIGLYRRQRQAYQDVIDAGGTSQEARRARLDTNVRAGRPSGPGALSRVGGARAALNENLGAVGTIGAAFVGLDLARQAFAAGKTISNALKEFGKLDATPKYSSPEDFRDSAKNLEAAAKALKESSHGFFGTVSNYLQGDPTGAAAKKAQDLARFQEQAADRMEKARTGAYTGSAEDAASTIDISSSDALSSSLDSLGKSGLNATEIMDAFQKRLEQIGKSGADATASLTDYQKVDVANTAGEKAQQIFQSLLPSSTNLSQSDYSDYGISEKDAGSFIKNLLPLRTDERKAIQHSKDLLNIDTDVAVGDPVTKAVQQFFDTGSSVDDKDAVEQLRRTLTASVGKGVNDPKRTQQTVDRIINQLPSLASNEAKGVNDTTIPFADLAAQIPALAQNKAAEAGVNFNLQQNADGTPYTKQQKGAALISTAATVTSQTYLDQLQTGYNTLLSETDGSAADKKKLDDLQAKIDAAKVDVASAVVDNLSSLGALTQASIPSQNTTDLIQDQIDTINQQLAVPNLSPEDQRQLDIKKLGLVQQLRLSGIDDRYAARGGKYDSRDALDLDRVDLQKQQALLKSYRKHGVDGKTLADQERAVRDAARKVQDDRLDIATQQSLSLLDSNSAVDQAKAQVITAQTTLAKALPGTAEYVAANKALGDARKAQAVADLQAENLKAQLHIDLSNPVQVARDNEDAAKKALALAQKQDEAPDVINQKRLDVRNAQLQTESATFQQFLTNVQNAEQLGDISHKAYMNLLQGRLTALQAELATMDPKSNGYQQIKDQITQLRQALKAGADELSGQFNIGDIKVPTPYEVRRALKTGSAGQIFAANGATSTAGNVTNDNSIRNVTLNGVPIEEVLTMIKDLFGVKARTRAARRIP